MKRLLCLLLSLMLLSVTSFAAEGVTVVVDGESLVCDVEGEIVNGRTFVPLRAIAERLGARIKWNGDTQGIALVQGEKQVDLAIGSLSASVTEGGRVSRAQLDAAPYIKDDRTMVPLRFIAQSLGRRVAWSADTSTAVITELRVISDSELKALTERYFSSVLPSAIKENGPSLAQDITKAPQSVMAYFSNLWLDEALMLLASKADKQDCARLYSMPDDNERYEYLMELGEKYNVPLECPVRMCPVNGGLLIDGPGSRFIDFSPLCILKNINGGVVCENLN